MTDHLLKIISSYKYWTGKDLISNVASFNEDKIDKILFEAPFVLLSHGTEPDPLLNYGNQVALNLWEMNGEEFTQTPSRLTAEPMNQKEREQFLKIVAQKGYIENYQGIRISKSGKRFRIEQAIVWNIINSQNQYCGQAATFEKWYYL